MGIDKTFEGIKIAELESSPNHMKKVIQKRLNLVENFFNIKSGSLIQITDSAYQAIAEVTKANTGLALNVLEMALPSPEQLAQKSPYIITEDHIKKLNLTYEGLCKYWDNPLRKANILHVKPWYEQNI